MASIKDSDGNELEVGAMYCCVTIEQDASGEDYDSYGVLVRYVGIRDGRQTFADADDWEETHCDFDKLARQAASVIDPAIKGWPLGEQEIDARVDALQRAQRTTKVVMPSNCGQEGYYHRNPS